MKKRKISEYIIILPFEWRYSRTTFTNESRCPSLLLVGGGGVGVGSVGVGGVGVAAGVAAIVHAKGMLHTLNSTLSHVLHLLSSLQ
jgi:hypothetical protein